MASAVAAEKYTVPPHPALGIKKCVIVFDKGYPKTTGDEKAWNVTANGKYNYDDTYQFVKLEVQLVYNNAKKGTTKNGPAYTVTNETTLAAPGSYSAVFNGVTPPDMTGGEVLEAIARITVTQNQKNETDSIPGRVLPP
jgi:hypothetical protein